MGAEPPPADRAGILRVILSAVVDLAGMFVAFRAVHKRATRRKRRAKDAEHAHKARGVAGELSPPDDSTVAHCIHCGRSVDDIRTLGCGGLNRKGKCPDPTRSR